MAFGPPFKARVSLMLFSFTPFPGECIRGWKSTKSASADSLLRLSPLPQCGRGVGGEGAFAGAVSTAAAHLCKLDQERRAFLFRLAVRQKFRVYARAVELALQGTQVGDGGVALGRQRGNRNDPGVRAARVE